MIIPPNTPICNVGIPKTTASLGFGFCNCEITSGTPLAKPTTTFMIKKPTNAASAATPSPPDKPTATPTQNKIGKLAKTIPPACSI